jgi:hypothetical protein
MLFNFESHQAFALEHLRLLLRLLSELKEVFEMTMLMGDILVFVLTQFD